jgi:hypothetical protein
MAKAVLDGTLDVNEGAKNVVSLWITYDIDERHEEFLQFQALKEQEVLARFDRLAARLAEQNASAGEEEVAADVADLDPEEAERLATQAVASVRANS